MQDLARYVKSSCDACTAVTAWSLGMHQFQKSALCPHIREVFQMTDCEFNKECLYNGDGKDAPKIYPCSVSLVDTSNFIEMVISAAHCRDIDQTAESFEAACSVSDSLFTMWDSVTKDRASFDILSEFTVMERVLKKNNPCKLCI